ncbi:hypothetical protein J7J84_08445 [bacterium]|nr:hypothetical protein [bacterium]
MKRLSQYGRIKPRSYALVLIALALVSMLGVYLVSCSRGRRTHPPQLTIAPIEPQDQQQQPDGSKEGAGDIVLDPYQFELSRLIGDIDAARRSGASQDTAVVTSVSELLVIDFISEEEIEVAYKPLSIKATEVWAEDFTGDGVDDVLAGGGGFSYGDDTVSLVVQSGGSFEEEETILSYIEVTALFPFYLDYYDDVIDIVTANSISKRLVGLFSASGDLEPYRFYAGAYYPDADVYYSCAAKADMDGNGREDAVLTMYGFTFFDIYFGYEREIQEEEEYDLRGQNCAITPGEENDVIPDESIATEDPDVLQAIDQGTLVLTSYRVALGDFNGDELPDTALLCRALQGEMDHNILGTVYHCDSYLVVQLNNGVPEGKTENLVTFTMSQASIIGPGGEDIGSADFDQDGNLDLVLSVSGARAIATARGNGDGTFEDFVYLNLGNHHPYRLAIGEFDDIEGIDAVMTCPMEQTLMFFLNNSELAGQ